VVLGSIFPSLWARTAPDVCACAVLRPVSARFQKWGDRSVAFCPDNVTRFMRELPFRLLRPLS
jgi:hypothetical protein